MTAPPGRTSPPSGRESGLPRSEAARDAVARWPVLAAMCIGAGALMGWALGLRSGLDPWLLDTKPTTAISLVLLGTAFLFAQRRDGRSPMGTTIVTGAVAAVALLCLLSLLETVREVDLGLDALWSPGGGAPQRARMSPISATNLGLLALAVGMLRTRMRAVVLTLCAVPLFLSLSALAGYLYGARPHEHALSLPPMVALSAVGVALLSAGVICTHILPETSALLTGRDASSSATRRQLLGLIAIPLLLGALELWFRRRALYTSEFGVALLAVANILLLVSLSLWSTHATLRAQRRNAERERELTQKEAQLEAEAQMQRERTRGQEALDRSEGKFRSLALHAPVGIFEADTTGACLFVNNKLTELTEQTFTEALGFGWAESIHPDDRERVHEQWSEITRSGQPFSIDYRFLAKSGRISWVEGHAIPLRDAGGAITGYLGALVDATERKQALDALTKSEQNFRTLVERAPFGVVVMRDARVVYINGWFAQLLGYDQSELIDGSVLDLVHVKDRALAAERLAAVAQGKAMSTVPITCAHKDGSEVQVEGTSAPIVFDGREALVAAVRDITEQQRAEQVRLMAERALRESLREKEVLLKEIHHRVKNNLQVIVSLVNLQASKLDDHAVRAAFDETRARVHAIALLHERLYRSKNLGRIDMRDYLKGLASDLSSTAERGGIEVRVNAEEAYWEMDSAVPIGLIVNELVTNAFKHAFPASERSHGRVDIELVRTGSECSVTVHDDGVGYPRGFDSETHDSLGLLLITSLSRQLGGEVTFTSSGGARAEVRFPDPARENGRGSGELRSA